MHDSLYVYKLGTRYTPKSNTITIMSAGKEIYEMRELAKTYPLHFPHRTLRDKDSFLVAPLYRSSNETFMVCTTSSPRFCLRPLELPPFYPYKTACKYIYGFNYFSESRNAFYLDKAGYRNKKTQRTSYRKFCTAKATTTSK
jgi:hypothetical protein